MSKAELITLCNALFMATNSSIRTNQWRKTDHGRTTLPRVASHLVDFAIQWIELQVSPLPIWKMKVFFSCATNIISFLVKYIQITDSIFKVIFKSFKTRTRQCGIKATRHQLRTGLPTELLHRKKRDTKNDNEYLQHKAIVQLK